MWKSRRWQHAQSCLSEGMGKGSMHLNFITCPSATYLDALATTAVIHFIVVCGEYLLQSFGAKQICSHLLGSPMEFELHDLPICHVLGCSGHGCHYSFYRDTQGSICCTLSELSRFVHTCSVGSPMDFELHDIAATYRSNLRCHCMEELCVGLQGGAGALQIIREAKHSPFL